MTDEIAVRTLAELEAHGMGRREVLAATKRKEFRRLNRGVYVRESDWKAHFTEGRQRANGRAAAKVFRDPQVFALHTSAAFQELPLFRVRGEDERVHTVTTAAAPNTSFVVRHEMTLTEADIIRRNGLLMTSLERTVFDLIRILPLEAGIALADAALRQREEEADGGAEALRASLLERIARAPGARGIRRARAVIAFADHRADSPGESAGRWYLHVLGFKDVGIQVPFPGPNGRDYALDFKFRRGIGELDGAAKYKDPRFLAGRTPEQALIDEKRREDWIRGRTQEPFVRWMDGDMPNADALGRFLARFGIIPPG
ncbi:hypothetical protein [Microbacterium rhizophilus]|uniref:hypothetical protein n=1 Tax=Microbacterium rhizophilus TaxID=3138934 RepID=UPI0031E667D4